MGVAGSCAPGESATTQVAIALSHAGAQHKLQFHHIFPKAVLKSSFTTREADDISNLCFIAGKTNRQISDKAPSQYFPPMIEQSGRAAFEMQCIPTTPELLPKERYKDFLSARRIAITQRLNDFLQTAQGRAQSSCRIACSSNESRA